MSATPAELQRTFSGSIPACHAIAVEARVVNGGA